MVPFNEVQGCNYDVLVNQWLKPSGIPIPEKVPKSYDKSYGGWGYYESLGDSPTSGTFSWIVCENQRKKEEEQAAAVEKLKKQQKALEGQVTRLTKQYQDLTALYNKTVSSAEADANTIAILKMQLESLVEVLDSLGVKISK